LPLAWRVAETEGAIGFATQQELLEVVAGWLSVGQAVRDYQEFRARLGG